MGEKANEASLIRKNPGNLKDRLTKWRLILGDKSDPNQTTTLESDQLLQMDATLEALYDSERTGSLGASSPNINRWLGDIRQYFPTSVVQIMQRDAYERLELNQMLLEPELLETIEADVNLVATLLSLNKVMPAQTKETARTIVRKVVKELEKKLRYPLQTAIRGSLHKATKNYRPRANEIDWHRTIRANLKHYQPQYNTIIPERLIGFGRKGQKLKNILLLIDQSGSMAASLVYSCVLGSILAGISAVRTHLIAFDTSVADLSDHLEDPVDLLFAAQLGGGTDINNALSYAQKLISTPKDTILVLISDLFEGGNERELINRVATIKASGVQFITLLALNDQGAPAYSKPIASRFAQFGIPAFACTPELFPDLMAAAIKKEALKQWAARNEIVIRN